MTNSPPPLRTVMVVEDDAIERMIYERIIRRSGAVAHIISFSYAEDALAYLEDGSGDIDAILLDINMPRMNGFEFLDEIERRFGAAFQTSIFMLTSSTHPNDAERARRYPAVSDFLNKPLTGSLVSRIMDGLQAA